MTRTIGSIALALLAAGAAVVSQTPSHAEHTVVTPDTLKWGPPPPGLPAGAQIAIVHGDPTLGGVPFTVRAKVPDGWKVPPHWHPTDEHLTVLSGTLMFGMGDAFDGSKMTDLPAGSYVVAPKLGHHYVQAKGETVIQINGIGPYAITYVNPEDDPTPKKPTS